MKKTLAILLIILGILLLFIPNIAEYIIKFKSNSVNIDNVDKNIIKENQNKNNVEFNYDVIGDLDVETILKNLNNYSSENLVGFLIVPKLGINLPIFNGINDINLMSGVTTMNKDQEMGKGNYPIAGHYMKRKDLLFGGLMDIKKGTKVYLTDKEHVYEYIIGDTELVPDQTIEMIDINKLSSNNKPIVSLMTCYYSSKTGKRFFAIGELNRVISYEQFKK